MVLELAVLVLCLSYIIGSAALVHYDATTEWPATDGYRPDMRSFTTALGVLTFASMHVLPWRKIRSAALDDPEPVTRPN